MLTTDIGLAPLSPFCRANIICIFPITSHVFGYTPLFGQHKAVVSGETAPALVSDVALALEEIIKTK